MRSFKFEDLVLKGANKNTIKFASQSVLFDNLINRIKSNRFAMMATVRFFAVTPTCESKSAYSWDEITQIVFDDILDIMEDLSVNRIEVCRFNSSVDILKSIFELNQSNFNMIRSDCLELINKLIILKEKRTFYHEPDHVYVKTDKDVMEFSTRQYKSRRLDFFALSFRNKNICVTECKSNLNSFYELAQSNMRGVCRRRKKNILKDRKQISYFKNFLKKFNARCLDGDCSGYFLTYLNEDSILDHGGTHKLGQKGEEFILNLLFEFVA